MTTPQIELAPVRETDYVPKNPVFEVRDLTVSYGTNVALRNVTLDVYEK